MVIFRRYLLVFLTVVGAAVLASSGVGLYFAYADTQARLDHLDHERVGAAQAETLSPVVSELDQTFRTFAADLRSFDASGVRHPTLAQRETGYRWGIFGGAQYQEISYIAPSGRELVRVGDTGGLPTRGTRFAVDPVVLGARARGIALGPAFATREENSGQMALRARMGVTESRPTHGVILAQTSLDFLPLLLASYVDASSGDAVYVVDGTGHLVARSDATDDSGLRDVSGMSGVLAALQRGEHPPSTGKEAIVGRDLAGRSVLATSTPLPLLGWYAIALRPNPGSHGPVALALWRTGISLLVCLALAAIASFALARRMTRPIRLIQEGATRIGEGALDERIHVDTGDELEQLAGEFNRMAARLQNSYATLEQRVEDRTRDLVEAHDQLERVSNEKTRFLANMSHELRTPLNAIINFADVLRDGSSGPLSPKQLSYAQDIHVAGQHLLDLITDILDLAKIEAGRIDLNMTTVDVVESLEAALQVVRERAKGKGVELRLEADPEVGCIEADARKLRQILFNLLTNAVRFTTPGGSVTIKAARHPDEVEIAVIDTGVGIDPADHERIFQEFEQAGSWEQRKEGTGLGLPLARRMIELHGGSLSLVSSPGRGSTFTVRLPLRPATSNASESTVPATTGA